MSTGHRLWIAGKVLDARNSRWEFQGVFDTEAAAVAACRDATYFIGPATLNKPLPHRATHWRGARYPKA